MSVNHKRKICDLITQTNVTHFTVFIVDVEYSNDHEMSTAFPQPLSGHYGGDLPPFL
jgi:hypothetical protein